MAKKKQFTRTELLRQWLKERDLFNISALCRRINYDRGAFSHWMEGHDNWDLSDEAASRLENALVQYGYKPNQQ